MSGEKTQFIRNRKYVAGKFSGKTLEDYRGIVTLGQMFGQWCVQSEEVRLGKYGPEILVKCNHTEKYVLYQNLKQGKSTHCPKCPKSGIEGMKKLRGRWEQIMDRCYNPEAKNYDRYGGRGIYVSEEFKDSRTFCRYVKTLPKDSDRHTHLDRIDNNKGYERGNLRWSTPSQNNRNKENLNWIILNGEKMCLQDFLEKHTDLSRSGVKALIKKGVSPEQISQLKRGESLRYCERSKQFKIRRTRWANIS